MKTKFALFAATLFAAAMISCSKDSSGETSPEVTPSGESTYMTVDLKILGANQTRAAGSANLAATGEESAVNDVRLYVFKANNTNYILETYVDFNASEATALKKTFQITTGQKVFHALVNMSGTYPSATVGTTSLDSFKQSAIGLTSIATAATDNAFWMTTLADATQTLVVATEAQASAGTYNNVSLSVGRAVAKVGVDLDESTVTQPIDGTLSGTSYKVVNNPNQIYALKVFNTLGYQLTPYYTSTYFTTGTDSFDNGSYLATTLDGSGYHEYPSYMVENSHDVPTYGNSNVVMIKGTFTPKVLYSTDGSTSYDVVTDLAGLETALNGTWDGTFWRTYDSSTKLYGTKFYYETPVTATGETAVKYDQGTSYYGLWLKNDTKSTSTEKYTVSRNQYWNVTITSIAGCGSNSEGGVIEEPGEENPIDENTYMMATIQVVDWEEVTQSGGI